MRKSNPNNEQEPKVPETASDYEAYAKSLLGQQEEVQPSTSSKVEPKTKAEQEDFTARVNSLIKEVTTDENGKIVYPDDITPELKYAVAAEKKYRDTQSGFTKSRQSLKEVEAENKALREQLAKASSTTLEIPKDKLDELEELKFSDPDAWRHEMNKLETAHSSSVQEGLNEQMSEVRSKVGAEYELERRVGVLEEFNKGRETPVTVEMLDNDIPPRISKKLADGHLTFEGYLAEVDEYLSKGKVVAGEKPPKTTKLTSGAGNSGKPSEATELESDALAYDEVIF